jgi:Ca2+-binding RTX toxin-like protein
MQNHTPRHQQQKSLRPISNRAAVETLEGRRLFAATVVSAVVVDGMLEVTGTNKSDDISIEMAPGNNTGLLQVKSKNTVVGEFDTVATPLTGIHVKAGNGNDQVVVFSDVLIAAHLEGGNGKDVLAGGGADDVVDGGNGNDQVAGGDGNDVVTGGNGKDDVDGGVGNDTVTGGKGKDHVVGGAGADIYSLADRDTELDSVIVEDLDTVI